ncbi:MAG: hypothetical protein LBM77_03050 [Spirochaetaceae bacterium]|nr:hypothetical protein [Spirochaetaceae bacterium]
MKDKNLSLEGYCGPQDRAERPLRSLIPLDHFKTLMGIDDREDGIARHCLEAASFAIEGYCRRKMMARKHNEVLRYEGERIFPLKEYPLREVLGVWLYRDGEEMGILEPDYWHTIPDDGLALGDADVPAVLVVSHGVRLLHGIDTLHVHYKAGYQRKEIEPDLGSACLELAMWNYTRVRGKKTGVVSTGSTTGAGRGRQAYSGVPVEKFEASMPENVRLLLEPYRRKMI